MAAVLSGREFHSYGSQVWFRVKHGIFDRWRGKRGHGDTSHKYHQTGIFLRRVERSAVAARLDQEEEATEWKRGVPACRQRDGGGQRSDGSAPEAALVGSASARGRKHE